METKQNQIADIFTKEGFESAFKEYYAPLCSYVFGYTGERAAAEEIVQDLFVKLWTKRKDIEIHGSVKSYLYRAVRNESLNLLKHIKVREHYKEFNQTNRDIEENRDHQELEQQETRERVEGAIAKLPEQRQKIFRMSRYESKKYKEIAEELDLSIKTIENQMGKALAFLRQELADLLPTLLLLIQILFGNGGK